MTNEPTTEVIIRALRGSCLVYSRVAADRIESQEREIEELKSEAIVNALDNAERIAELTARAESAERERDAFIEKIKGRCSECEYEPLTSNDEPCASCHTKNGYPNWKWRGLQPQEGEGK